MLLSLMCADECGVVWPYLLKSDNITDGIAVPDDIDALRATLASIVLERRRRWQCLVASENRMRMLYNL
jgi:hypothetical protein